MRVVRVLFIVVMILCGLDTLHLWFQSPDVMAVHFDIQGNPDRFVPRLEFFSDQALTLLIVIAAGIVLQVLPKILPWQWINLRDREYWSSPEKRATILNQPSSFGAVLSTIFLLAIQMGFKLAASANLHEPIVFASQTMLAVIALFFIMCLVLLFWFLGSFRLLSRPG